MKVSEAVIERRSIKYFDKNHKMTEDEKNKILSLAMMSPTSFNIQNWRFLIVEDQKIKDELRKAAYGQAQVSDCSMLIVLCADLKAWEKEPKRYFGKAPEEVKKAMVNYLQSFYKDNQQLQRDEAFRSCGIAAQTIMLTAKEMGYDTCAMAGFDIDKAAEIINLPKDHIITMFVVVGKKIKDPQPKVLIDFNDVVIKDQF